MSNEKWDKRFLSLAKFIASWSKDPRTQVGCVIADKRNRIVGLGFNGFPRHVHDSQERYENRDLKLQMVLHAEQNALMLSNRSVEGCTLYVWPMPPCVRCTAEIIQAGIDRVVSVYMEDRHQGSWGDSVKLANAMLVEAKVASVLYNM